MTSDAHAAFGAPNERKRTGTLGYWLAGLLGVLAVAGAITWFVGGLSALGDDVDALQRVTIPGTRMVTLEAGRNAVYYEGNGSLRSLQIQLQTVDGRAVRVGPHDGEVSYDSRGHSGRSVAGFTIERAGRYRMNVDGGGGTIAVGKGVGGQLVSAILGGLGIFFGGLLLCGLLIVLTARARRA